MESLLFLFLILIGIFSCEQHGRSTLDKKDSLKLKIDFSKFDYSFDTTFYDSDTSSLVKFQKFKWSEVDDFFPVYKFSDQLFGIGIEIGNGGNYKLIDSLVKNYNVYSDSFGVIIDTSGPYTVKKSVLLENVFYNNDTTKFFNIICQYGKTKAKITDVFVGMTDCSEVLILKLSPIDTQKFGFPLIAIKKDLDLKYSKDNIFQRKLVEFNKWSNQKADFTDSIIPVQFAKNDSQFFIYSDDFKWFSRENGYIECLYPARSIYTIKDKKVIYEWSAGLDLFGIPCY